MLMVDGSERARMGGRAVCDVVDHTVSPPILAIDTEMIGATNRVCGVIETSIRAASCVFTRSTA